MQDMAESTHKYPAPFSRIKHQAKGRVWGIGEAAVRVSGLRCCFAKRIKKGAVSGSLTFATILQPNFSEKLNLVFYTNR